MRILVTGGRGFIGSHLVERLIEGGHQVSILDNRITGNNRINNGRLVESDVKGDVRDTESWGSLQSVAFDRIYHCACPASPRHYQRHPLLTIDTAYIGTRNILNLAKKWKARVLITSTSEVYGDPKESPQEETYWGNVNCYGPRAMYDEGKRAAEALAWVYQHEYKAEVRIARIFNTYGPRMALDDGRMVPEFILAALQGKPLPIMGSGSQTRSLCYVDDTVDGLVRLMECAFETPVNIGNPVEMKVKDVAELITRIAGSTAHALRLPEADDDPQRRCPSIGKAKGLLGWEPKVGVEDGLTRTIDWFRATAT